MELTREQLERFAAETGGLLSITVAGLSITYGNVEEVAIAFHYLGKCHEADYYVFTSIAGPFHLARLALNLLARFFKQKT